MLFRRGAQGLFVRAIQFGLNAWSGLSMRPLAPDGKFGPLTDGRVRAFQSAKRIGADGIVGPTTFSKLITGVQLETKVRVTNQRKPGAAAKTASTLQVRAPNALTAPIGRTPEEDARYRDWLKLMMPPIQPILTPQQQRELQEMLERIRHGSSLVLPDIKPPLPIPAPPPPRPVVAPAKERQEVTHMGARTEVTFDPGADKHDQTFESKVAFGVLEPPDSGKLNVEVEAKRLKFDGRPQDANAWNFEVVATLKPFELKPLPWLKLAPVVLSTLDPESWQLFAGLKTLVNIRVTNSVNIQVGGKFGSKYEYKFDSENGQSRHEVAPFKGGGFILFDGQF